MDNQIETKQELDSKAKNNLESNPNEAVKIYKSMYEQYPDQFNSWDAFTQLKR